MGQQKTHDRFQPWVFVEIQFNRDKSPRRRSFLLRLSEPELVADLRSFCKNIELPPRKVKRFPSLRIYQDFALKKQPA
jgi:hypothetical protein